MRLKFIRNLLYVYSVLSHLDTALIRAKIRLA